MKNKTTRKSDRQRIQFAFNSDLDSDIGTTFQYLIKNAHFSSRVGKHKGIDAITTFWKPMAYQEQGDLTAEELKAIARESIEALNRQIDLICDTFGLERPQQTTSNQNLELRQEIQQAVSAAFQQLVSAGTLSLSSQDAQKSAKSDKSAEEGVDFDEDTLFGNLLDDASIAA
ncbi:MAG: hypothetical protein F6K19_15180 [Cyanothece sp. SIO1E1]|nr:hypothetical protein [Cyanothece sp. SIO1E1]